VRQVRVRRTRTMETMTPSQYFASYKQQVIVHFCATQPDIDDT